MSNSLKIPPNTVAFRDYFIMNNSYKKIIISGKISNLFDPTKHTIESFSDVVQVLELLLELHLCRPIHELFEHSCVESTTRHRLRKGHPHLEKSQSDCNG